MSGKHHGSLRRFMVDEIVPEGGLFTIRGQEARHAARVLRLGPGDRLILVDRKGCRFLAQVESVRAKEVLVSIREPLRPRCSLAAEITLCQALLRSGPMDLVIQKATELGVSRIVPFISERTLVRPDEKGLANKRRHWEEIARSASKQSDRDRPPEILPPAALPELLAPFRDGKQLKIVLWEGEEKQDLKSILREGCGVCTEAVGIVGPEGGFGEGEIRAARSAGFLPASIGQRVIRAETASIALMVVLQYEWGDLGGAGEVREEGEKVRR